MHMNLVNAFGQKQDLEGALRHGREALRIEPGNADAHLFLAGVFAAQGRAGRAMAHYADILEHQPEHVEARRRLAGLRARESGESQ